MATKLEKQQARRRRVRAKAAGTKQRPRLTVHKSNKHFFAQVIADDINKTLIGVSSKTLPESKTKGKKRSEVASILGEEIASLAKAKKITKVVFDRSGYRYHGSIKKFAESARKGGLKF